MRVAGKNLLCHRLNPAQGISLLRERSHATCLVDSALREHVPKTCYVTMDGLLIKMMQFPASRSFEQSDYLRKTACTRSSNARGLPWHGFARKSLVPIIRCTTRGRLTRASSPPYLMRHSCGPDCSPAAVLDGC